MSWVTLLISSVLASFTAETAGEATIIVLMIGKGASLPADWLNAKHHCKLFALRAREK